MGPIIMACDSCISAGNRGGWLTDSPDHEAKNKQRNAKECYFLANMQVDS